jgi:uncharacterized protein
MNKPSLISTTSTLLPGTAAIAGPERSSEIDALRGFALIGIVVVNAPLFAVPSTSFPTIGTGIDAVALSLVLALGVGKFFLIFSLLFGFGLSELMARRDGAADADAMQPLWRRLTGLFVFGLAHAVFLFFGDILMLYAALGSLLVLLRRASDRTLLLAAAVALAVGLATQSLFIAESVLQARQSVPSPVASGYLGGVLDATLQRVRDLPIGLVGVALFNGPVALAMILLGRVWHRRGGLAALRRWPVAVHRRIVLAAVPALVLSLPAAGVLVAGLAGAPAATPIAVAVASVTLSLGAPLLSAGLVIGVLHLVAGRTDRGPLRPITALGRASLTGYLLHSLLLSAIFLGWGLGLFGSVGPGAILGIAVAVYLAMVLMVGAWLRAFRLGPAEWLLRSFIERRWLALR